MYAAMPAVLKKAIEQTYQDCGWDLISSVNTYSKPFSQRLQMSYGQSENYRLEQYDNDNKSL